MSSIKQIVRQPDIFMFPQWDSDVSYYTTSIVTRYNDSDGRYYIYMAKNVSQNSVPSKRSDDWIEISYDSDHLQILFDKLWDRNYSIFKQAIDSDVANVAEYVFRDVDSELRETRADVNKSLVNFLQTTVNNLDSELRIVRAEIDSDKNFTNQIIDNVTSLLSTDLDSDVAVLNAKIITNDTNLWAAVNHNKAALDSDKTSVDSRIATNISNIAINASDISTINNELIRLKNYDSDHLKTYLLNKASADSRFNAYDLTFDKYDSDILYFRTTNVKIYSDIQSNRDRIIVLENEVGNISTTIDNIESNEQTLQSHTTSIAQLNADLTTLSNTNDGTHISIYNDISDIRTLVSKISLATGIDSDFELHNLDSEWVTRQIVTAIIDDMIDSDWINRQIPKDEVDSDWVHRQIPDHVYSLDSDWVSTNHININDSDSIKFLTEKIKLDLDMGTF